MKRSMNFPWKRQLKKDKISKDKDEPTAGDTKNKGEVLHDATVCPQDIAYPTDLGLLNKAREITEDIIDELHDKNSESKKSRTYREIGRKAYLKVTQNKNPSKKVIRKGIRCQLQCLRRNFKAIG
jgi:transposase, IS5 family